MSHTDYPDSREPYSREPRRPLPTSAGDLDQASQRRVVLGAARQVAAGEFPKLCKEPKTLDELRKELKEAAWLSLFFCWIPFVPIAVAVWAIPLIKVLLRARRDWRQLLMTADPEIDLWILADDINRIMKQLPKTRRKEAKKIARELERAVQHWSGFNHRLAVLEATFGSVRSDLLTHKREELEARLELETDPVTADFLRRQLAGIDAQSGSANQLVSWRARMEAARDGCLQSLQVLRSELAVALATTQSPSMKTIQTATQELQELNARLLATEEATAEVMHLGRGAGSG